MWPGANAPHENVKLLLSNFNDTGSVTLLTTYCTLGWSRRRTDEASQQGTRPLFRTRKSLWIPEHARHNASDSRSLEKLKGVHSRSLEQLKREPTEMCGLSENETRVHANLIPLMRLISLAGPVHHYRYTVYYTLPVLVPFDRADSMFRPSHESCWGELI